MPKRLTDMTKYDISTCADDSGRVTACLVFDNANEYIIGYVNRRGPREWTIFCDWFECRRVFTTMHFAAVRLIHEYEDRGGNRYGETC